MEEYGVLGIALVALALFTRWLVLKTLTAAEERETRLREDSDRREQRLTSELAESRKQFIDHLEKGSQEQINANLAIATQLSKLNEAAEAHDTQAQRRHDASMKVMQEMSTQLAWYRERHEGAQR